MPETKTIPKKLDEELENVKYYKPERRPSNPISASSIMDHSAERAMYDEILGPLMGRTASKPITPRDDVLARASSAITTAPAATDFTTTIINRLKVVETEAKNARKQLAEQVVYNEKLELEIVNLQAVCAGSEGVLDEMTALRKQNVNLKSKLREMEKFLSDYGLVWVGSADDVSDNSGCTDSNSGSGNVSNSDAVHPMPFSEFNQKIQELNAILYSEPAQVVTSGHNSRQARLVQASELVENIRVVFYRNGLMIRRGPFRPCGSESYESFARDVMDGYFPSEFRAAYPEGVTFDLVDRHEVTYSEGAAGAAGASEQQMSGAQFLKNLPKTVIRNGEVVAIRDGIAARLTDESAKASSISSHPHGHVRSSSDNTAARSAAVIMSTPAVLAGHGQSSRHGHSASDASSLLGKVAQVQVRYSDGGAGGSATQNQLLLAHMYEHDSVRDLRQEIARSLLNENRVEQQQHVAGSGHSAGAALHGSNSEALAAGIELRSAYPPRVLTDGMTLKEAGLVPNGTVHAKKL